jgi:hypothetical protein
MNIIREESRIFAGRKKEKGKHVLCANWFKGMLFHVPNKFSRRFDTIDFAAM